MEKPYSLQVRPKQVCFFLQWTTIDSFKCVFVQNVKMIGLINWRSTATKIYLTSCWHSTFQPVPKPGRVPQTTWFEAKTSSCVGPKHGPSLCFVKVQSNHLWGEDLWIFDVGKCVKKRNKDDFLHCVQKDSTWCSISVTMIKSIAALRSPKSLKAELFTKVAEAHPVAMRQKKGWFWPHPNKLAACREGFCPGCPIGESP